MEVIVKKSIGLTVALLLLSVALFSLVIFTSTLPLNPAISITLAVVVVVWLSVLAINIALLTRPYAWINILSVTGLFILFARAQLEAFIGALFFLVFAATARRAITHELANRIEYSTRAAFYPGLKYLVMGTVLLGIGFAVPFMTASLLSDDQVVPESLVRFLLKPYQPYLQKILPSGALDSSFEDTMAAVLNQQSLTDNIPLEQRQSYVEEISQQLSLDRSGTDNIATVITAIINNKIRLYSHANPVLIPIFIFAIAIIVSRIVIVWLAHPPLLVVALFVWLARQTKLVKLVSVSQPVEKLVL